MAFSYARRLAHKAEAGSRTHEPDCARLQRQELSLCIFKSFVCCRRQTTPRCVALVRRWAAYDGTKMLRERNDSKLYKQPRVRGWFIELNQ